MMRLSLGLESSVSDIAVKTGGNGTETETETGKAVLRVVAAARALGTNGQREDGSFWVRKLPSEIAENTEQS